jgi:hypothetical protein
MPYTTYYFASAVVLLLQQRKLPCRGLLLGRFLLILMKQLREDHQESKTKIPGLRFATYRKVVVPGKEEWIASTKEVVRLCLEASFRTAAPGDKKERGAVYEKTRKAIAKEIPDAGSLISNHLMAVLAIVGLVPLWFVEEHSIDVSSKSIAYLVQEKGLAKGRASGQRFLDSVSSALERQFGIVCCAKYSENVVCKAFRLICTIGSDEQFLDLAFHNQCVFEVKDGNVLVHRLGFQTITVVGPLIDKWALGGKLWSLPQLLLQFESTEKAAFHIPKGLGDLGNSKFIPSWVGAIFPSTADVHDWGKADRIVRAVINIVIDTP